MSAVDHFLAADTTSALGTLRDMKNLRTRPIVGLYSRDTHLYFFEITIITGPKQVIDDLDPAKNGEACEETHCASDQSKLGLRCHLGRKMIFVKNLTQPGICTLKVRRSRGGVGRRF